MAFTVEIGTGIVGANSYVTVAEANDYLADRGRSAENGWQSLAGSAKQSALIKATDYIEQRYSGRFSGQKEFLFREARATISFTQAITTGQTVTIDGTVFTADTEFVVATKLSETIDNLATAITDNAIEFSAERPRGWNLILTADAAGPDGNLATVATNVTGATASAGTLLGGTDSFYTQPLAFPRNFLYDRRGNLVIGIPDKLKWATIEYGIRAVAAELFQDPTVDESGRSVARLLERVGPIETEVEYSEGTGIQQLIKPYPAADKWLSEYTNSGSGVIR